MKAGQNVTSNSKQTGHDAPLSDRSEDYYDRWAVAKNISNIIATAPSEWSTRIGLFGPWGSGKTSVLNFVEQQQVKHNNIVIRYAPWGATTPDEVWKDFGKALIAGLSKHGVKLTWWVPAWHWLKARGATQLKAGIKGIGHAAELTGHAPGASKGAEFASSLIGDKLTFTKQDMLRLIQQLGSRRVVVFIDDLDRAEPAVMPKLLLVLRELLDFAQFAFVLAFDREIVATALQKSNPGWENAGQSFLDKVVDFRVDLPPPTTYQVRRLGLDQFKRLCSFVPTKFVEAKVSLLPTNPRKLKLLARMIASTKDEVERHDGDELDWGVILLVALVRAESEALATKLLAITIDRLEFAFRDGYEQDNEKEARKNEELRLLLEEFPDLNARKDRVELLLDAWQREVPTYAGERVRYQAMFALTPHCITWGEFKQFLAKWEQDKRADLIADFIAERVSASEARVESVHTELSNTVVNHYSTILETASGVKETIKHRRLVQDGSDALDLFLQCVTGAKPALDLSKDQLVICFERLLGIALQWRHFDANEGEPELRNKEELVLAEFGKAVADPLLVYEKLSPDLSHDSYFDPSKADLKMQMTERLRAQFEPMARSAAMAFVSEPGRIKKLRTREASRATRYLLCSPESPLFKVHQAMLMSTFAARRNTEKVVEDAFDYMTLLLSALEHNDQEICTAAERREFIKRYPPFMTLIWDLCVSEPSQFRMWKGLLIFRDQLIANGVSEKDLLVPEWLKGAATSKDGRLDLA